MHRYTVSLLPYEDRQFYNVKDFARALEILAARLKDQHSCSCGFKDRMSKPEDLNHGRVLFVEGLPDADLPAFAWVMKIES